MKKEKWLGVFLGFVICVIISAVVGFINMHRHNDRLYRRMTHDEKTRYRNSGNELHSAHMTEEMRKMSENLKDKSGDEFDRTFLREMIVHHEGAIDMANQALVNAQNPEIKNMAKNIIETQIKEIDQMKKWESEWYLKK